MNTFMRSAFMAVSLLALGQAAPVLAQDDDATTLSLASTVDNNSFDVGALQIGHRVQYWMPVFDTLLVLDPKMNAQPNLATEFTYNADNTVLNLKLREGVSFTDGAPFNAAAVKANIEYIRDAADQNSYMVGSVKDVEIVSDYEVNLVLNAPDPGLIGYLGMVGGAIASPATLGTEASATTPIGSGAYVLDASETVAGRQYVYTRNADYWNKDAYPFEKMVIIPMNDLSARLNALKSGQIDAAAADAKSIAEAEGAGLTVNATQVDWQGLIIADRAGKSVPALADVRVRQALNFAFDKEGLVKHLLLDRGAVIDQPFNLQSQAFDPSLVGTYAFNIDKARELMKEAGFENGFTVKMPSTPAFASYEPIIEQTLNQLNITVEWEKVAANAFIADLLAGKYPLFLMSLASQTAWMDFRRFAFTESPWNTSHVDDPALAELLKTAQLTTGEAQDEAMKAANRYITENAFFAPWFMVDAIYLTDAGTRVDMQNQNIVPWPRNFAPAN